MSDFDHDVLVIGAGPAGSTAAAFARQAGLRVCVLEKAPFPRFRIGESLLPNGNALLRESGVWPKLESAGFIKKFGAFFFLANGTAEKEVIFSEGIVRGLDYTYQVDRARFDAILLDHARALGAEVRMDTTARAVSPRPHGLEVAVEDSNGIHKITTRWVLDAGGRDGAFRDALKTKLEPASAPKRVAIYNHFRGASRAPGRAAGHTTVVRLFDGWFWLIPIDAERTSIGLVTTVDAMRRARAEPAEIFRRAVADSPKLRELAAGAEPTMDFHVTSDYSYFRQELADERLLLLGDAGGFFDPIFSSGVYVAMNSAKLAVDAIVRAQRADRGLTPTERQRYTRAIKQHAGVFQKLIQAFYDNDSFSVFMCPRPPLRLDRGVNSIVAGHARLIWPIWWRFRLFLLVCKWQKHFAFVPRIAFDGMARVADNEAAPSGHAAA